MKEYVLSFIIGSSILAYMLWVISLSRVDIKYYNFDGYIYYILMPNLLWYYKCLITLLFKKYKLSKLTRLIVTRVYLIYHN